MADGGRDRCFEDIVCILFKDEKRATVVVSTVIQLLQPPLPFVRQRHGYEFGGSVRRDPVRPMTTAVVSMSTVVI